MSECNENHGRSIAKAVSYRVLSIVADLVIVYVLTRNISLTAGIVGVTNISSTFLYYLHERGWNKIHFKRGPLKDTVRKPRKSRRKTT